MGRRIDVGRIAVVVAAGLVGVGVALAAVPGATGTLPQQVRALDGSVDPETLQRVGGGLLVVVALLLALVIASGESDDEGATPTPLDPRTGTDGPDEGALGADSRGGSIGPDGRRSADAGDSSESRERGTSPHGSGDSGPSSRVRGRRRGRPVGEDLTAAYEQQLDSLRAATGCPEPEPTEGLRRTAVALELATGAEPAEAHARIDDGEWTDDPVAAAFLGGPQAGSLSLRRRCYGVLFPERSFERRFERTLAALETRQRRRRRPGRPHGETARDRHPVEDAAPADGTPADDAAARDTDVPGEVA